jgi:sodium-independent sulfate anion transporter 11
VALGFFTGVIEILCGLLNLGFLVQFISQPVIVAFSSAVAVQVFT